MRVHVEQILEIIIFPLECFPVNTKDTERSFVHAWVLKFLLLSYHTKCVVSLRDTHSRLVENMLVRYDQPLNGKIARGDGFFFRAVSGLDHWAYSALTSHDEYIPDLGY